MQRSFRALPCGARRAEPERVPDFEVTVGRVRGLAFGCALFTACGCQELRVRVSEWAVPPSAHASSNVVEVSVPERFLVLNVASEDSQWTLDRALGTGERVGVAVADRGRSPGAASGQLVINPEDLSRTRGVVSGPDVEYRLRKVSVTGPSTLASLAPSGTRTQLDASGELTYRSVSRPVELTLLVEADIADGQLNSLRIVTARPLDLAMQSEGPQTGEQSAAPASSMKAAGTAGATASTAGTAASAPARAVSFDLVARPSPTATNGVR